MVKVKIKNESGEAVLKISDLDRFYDCGVEFDIELTKENIQKLLEANEDIALDVLKWGNDTEVGDRFFEALVEDITGEKWDAVKKMFGDAAYGEVKLQAGLKGYVIIP